MLRKINMRWFPFTLVLIMLAKLIQTISIILSFDFFANGLISKAIDFKVIYFSPNTCRTRKNADKIDRCHSKPDSKIHGKQFLVFELTNVCPSLLQLKFIISNYPTTHFMDKSDLSYCNGFKL